MESVEELRERHESMLEMLEREKREELEGRLDEVRDQQEVQLMETVRLYLLLMSP